MEITKNLYIISGFTTSPSPEILAGNPPEDLTVISQQIVEQEKDYLVRSKAA